MNDVKNFDEYEFPRLIFKLNESSFALNCKTVTSITILPDEITPMPLVPDYARGILNLRGTIIPLLDTRCLFSMPSLKKEYDDFSAMMDIRIKDHLNWVKELERCSRNNEEFTLTTDPHKCAFGIWYDNYKSDNNLINFHLKKIDQPHKKLHAIGQDIKDIMRFSDSDSRAMQIEALLAVLNKELVPRLVSLLEETKKVLKESYRETVVVLESGKNGIGMIVDEVQSVEKLEYLCDEKNVQAANDSKYIIGVAKSAKTQNLILIVDENAIRNVIEQSDTQESEGL